VDKLWISRPCGADTLAIARPRSRARGDSHFTSYTHSGAGADYSFLLRILTLAQGTLIFLLQILTLVQI